MINKKRALQHLLDFLATPGHSGREEQVAKLLIKKLKAAGCKASWIHRDQVQKKIPQDFECGNVIVKLPGTVKAPRIMISGHMDTVPLCKGAEPVIKGNKIQAKGKTGLGGDNRVSLGVMVNLIETLFEHNIPHPPLTLLATVGEEVGLWGARFVSKKDLGNPKAGINIDSGDPNKLVIGAIGAHRWTVDVYGVSAHAGVHPEQGISSTLIAAQAIAEVKEKGYFGKVNMKGKKGTSNIGIIQGGEATNQVTDHVYLKGESRSHDPVFLEEITSAYQKAFERAAKRNKNKKKQCGKIKFHADKDYDAFKLEAKEPIVQTVKKAAKEMSLKPFLKVVDGGLDANYFNAKRIPTITVGAGQNQIHTIDEYVDINQYHEGCELVLKSVCALA